MPGQVKFLSHHTEGFMFQKFLFSFSVLLLLNACVPQPTPPAATATVTPAPTHTLSPTSTPSPGPTATATSVGGGTGRLIFSMARGNGYFEGYQKAFPELRGKSNIFTSDLDGTHLV